MSFLTTRGLGRGESSRFLVTNGLGRGLKGGEDALACIVKDVVSSGGLAATLMAEDLLATTLAGVDFEELVAAATEASLEVVAGAGAVDGGLLEPVDVEEVAGSAEASEDMSEEVPVIELTGDATASSDMIASVDVIELLGTIEGGESLDLTADVCPACAGSGCSECC